MGGALYFRDGFFVTAQHGRFLDVNIDEVEFHGRGQTFDVAARKTGRSKGGSEEAIFQFLNSILLGVDFGDIKGQIRLEVGQGLCGQGQIPCGMFEGDRAHAFEVDALIEAIVARRLFAFEKFVELARESFVILAVALRGLAIRFHFSSEIAQSGLALRAMLAVFVPVVRPQGEKYADSYERDFEEQVKE